MFGKHVLRSNRPKSVYAENRDMSSSGLPRAVFPEQPRLNASSCPTRRNLR